VVLLEGPYGRIIALALQSYSIGCAGTVLKATMTRRGLAIWGSVTSPSSPNSSCCVLWPSSPCYSLDRSPPAPHLRRDDRNHSLHRIRGQASEVVVQLHSISSIFKGYENHITHYTYGPCTNQPLS